MHLKARDVMTRPVYVLQPETSVGEAARLFVQRRISSAPVVDRAGRLVGIVTEADLLPKVLGETGPPPEGGAEARGRQKLYGRRVEEVMTRTVVTASEEAPVRDLAALMVQRRVKRIPIVRGEHVVGIVTRNDVLKVFFRTDGELQRAARGALRAAPVPLTSVRVRVRDGVVTASGKVESEEALRVAELVLRGVEGVVDVDLSGVRVVHPSPG